MGRRWLRVTLGVLWLVDAGLQAEPAKFAANYPLGVLAQSVMGDPSWVNRSIYAGINPFVAHWAWWNLGATLLQVVIGLCLIIGTHTKPALTASFVWAAVIWWLGEGFAAIPAGFGLMAAGAPGAAVLYVLLGVLAWPVCEHQDVNRRAWTASWFVLWVGAAVLHFSFVYPVGQVLQANLEENASSTKIVAAVNAWFAHLSAHHALAITFVLVILETTIGVASVVDGARRRTWLGLSIVVSLFFWVVVQQFGGIPAADATDPDTAPLVILMALTAWPRSATPTTRPLLSR